MERRPSIYRKARPTGPSIIFTLALLTIAVIYPATLEASDAPGDVVIKPHIFQNEAGEKLIGEKGRILVPEVRDDPNSRLIKVAFIRIPAMTDSPAPPVFYLHGGPNGEGVIDSQSSRLERLKDMQNVADYIFVDGRGLGASEPRLSCPVEPDIFMYDYALYRRTFISEAAKCIAELTSQGLDLRGYNPKEYADDVHDLATALGYQRYSLTGNSFGSYWAMSIIKRHEEAVYRAAISGVFGLDGAIDLPQEMQAAFDDLSMRIDASPVARQLFGEKGFTRTFDALMRRLEKEPIDVEVDFNGRKETLRFDPPTLTFILYLAGMTQHREAAAKLPMLIFALDQGAYRGVGAMLARELEKGLREEAPEINISAMATICNEVNSEAFMSEFAAQSALPMRDHWIGSFAIPYAVLFGCEELGIPLIDRSWAEPFTSDVPIFAMIGSFDGNTPPAGARRALSKFPNRTVVTVNAGGHRHREIEQLWPELNELRRAFLSGDDIASAPDEIELTPIEFDAPPWLARQAFRLGMGNLLMSAF